MLVWLAPIQASEVHTGYETGIRTLNGTGFANLSSELSQWSSEKINLEVNAMAGSKIDRQAMSPQPNEQGQNTVMTYQCQFWPLSLSYSYRHAWNHRKAKTARKATKQRWNEWAGYGKTNTRRDERAGLRTLMYRAWQQQCRFAVAAVPPADTGRSVEQPQAERKCVHVRCKTKRTIEWRLNWSAAG